jgi:hypothetical protein
MVLGLLLRLSLKLVPQSSFFFLSHLRNFKKFQTTPKGWFEIKKTQKKI